MKRKEMRKGNGECLPSSLEKVERVCTEIGGTRGGEVSVEDAYFRIWDCCAKSLGWGFT
jgi:hypothetical protein